MIYPQHISRDNYTGMWNSPSSWSPEWSSPVHDSLNFDITINGYITLEGKLSFANFNTILTVNDTLVIKNDLILGNRNQLNVADNGILIIKGNLVINNKTLIASNGYIVICGNIIKVGSINQGSFTSNDNPAKVFIGGSVPAILSDVPAYPVLDSVAPLPKTGYPDSGAGYGSMTDILGDRILAFLNSMCSVKRISCNSPVCEGQAIKLESSGGIACHWTGPGGFNSTEQSPVIISSAISMSGMYSVTFSGEPGCFNETKTVNVLVKELPSATAAANNPVCSGDTIKISATGGTSYVWRGPGGFSGSGQSLSLPHANLSMAGSYNVTMTDADGCSSSATALVIVNDLPSVSITDNNPVCAGSALNFSAAGGTGFSWSGPGGFSSTGASVSRVNADPDMSGTYMVIVTDVNGCKSNKSVVLTVNNLPAVSAESNSPVCAGSTLTLSAKGGTTYLWTGPDGFSGSGSNISIANALTSMSGAYSLKITDLNGCESKGQVNVIVNPIPEGTIESLKERICTGDKLLLIGNPSGGVFNIISGPGSLSGNTLTGKAPGRINIEYTFTGACTVRLNGL
jgi:hypothetical protein